MGIYIASWKAIINSVGTFDASDWDANKITIKEKKKVLSTIKAVITDVQINTIFFVFI